MSVSTIVDDLHLPLEYINVVPASASLRRLIFLCASLHLGSILIKIIDNIKNEITVSHICDIVTTFRMSHRRCEMYMVTHICVCLSVCLSVVRCIPILLRGPGYNLAEW